MTPPHSLELYINSYIIFFYFQETEEEESEKGMSGHLLGWRCNICFSGFRRLDFSCFLFLLMFFNLGILVRHVESGSFTDIKTSHPEHVLHQRTDNPSPFVLTSVIILISSSNSFKSTLPCHHISSARGDLSPARSPFRTPPKLQQATSFFL